MVFIRFHNCCHLSVPDESSSVNLCPYVLHLPTLIALSLVGLFHGSNSSCWAFRKIMSHLSSLILTRLIQHDHCNPSTGFGTVKNQHRNRCLILVFYLTTSCSLSDGYHGKLLPDYTVSKRRTSRSIQSAFTLQYL
jgi:hypothetical protein